MKTSPIDAAKEIFAAFPEWQAFARAETDNAGQPYLVVEVSPPESAHVEHGLVIDTSNQEVTVGFDCYHCHFDEWIGEGEQFGTLAAVEFIKQIVSERVAVISWWFNDQWRGSAQWETGALPELPSWAQADTVNRIRVRSWKGLFNVDRRT